METTDIKNIEYLYLGEKSNFFSVSSCGVQHKKNGLRPNHLGNVHLVLSDRKQTSTYDNTLAAYEYYPFGMAMQTYETDAYRYGFNGMEKDDEWNGSGNSYDFGARIYDARLGRWLTVDPLYRDNLSISTYSFALNSPLIFIDPDGEDAEIAIDGDQITVNVKIHLSGDGATKEMAKNIQDRMMSEWNSSEDWDYKSDKGLQYKVKFNIEVSIENTGQENSIILDNDLDGSFVRGGNEGHFNPNEDVKGGALASKMYAHELGHMLGLTDYYSDVTLGDGRILSVADPEHDFDLMANTQGYVNLSHIERIVSPTINKLESVCEKVVQDFVDNGCTIPKNDLIKNVQKMTQLEVELNTKGQNQEDKSTRKKELKKNIKEVKTKIVKEVIDVGGKEIKDIELKL